MKRLGITIMAANSDCDHILEKNYGSDKESTIGDIIEHLRSEQLFNTDDDNMVITGDLKLPFLGIMHNATKFITSNPGHDQQTINKAYQGMNDTIKNLDLNNGLTPVIKKLHMEIIKLSKIQKNCIKRSPHIMAKIPQGESIKYALAVIDNNDLLG